MSGMSKTKALQMLKRNIDISSFPSPTQEQLIVKSRVKAYLEEGAAIVDETSLTIEMIESITGCNKIQKWASSSPSFIPWLLDKDGSKHRVQAMAEAALNVLEDILLGEYVEKVLTAKDKLNAANIILTLADRFPNKRKETIFLDRAVGKLTEDEASIQIEEYKRKLLAMDAEKA